MAYLSLSSLALTPTKTSRSSNPCYFLSMSFSNGFLEAWVENMLSLNVILLLAPPALVRLLVDLDLSRSLWLLFRYAFIFLLPIKIKKNS